MAWRDERPGVPLQPAIARSERDRERLDPPASVRYRELFASGVGRPPRPQDLESADSTKVVTCAVFALPPPLDFPPQQLRRNNEDVVIPFPRPIFLKHSSQLNKVCFNGATNS